MFRARSLVVVVAVLVAVARAASPPAFTVAPHVSDVPSDTQVQLALTVDTGGYCVWVIAPHGSTAPTATEVADVQLSGGDDPIAFAALDVSSGVSVEVTLETGTSCQVGCDAYVVCEDDQTWPEMQAAPTLVEFSTDTGAPQFQGGTPAVADGSPEPFRVEVDVQLDEDATVYVVAILDDSAAPSVSDVVALKAAGGGEPAAGSSVTAAAGATTSVVLNGLTSEAVYDLYVAAVDFANPPNTVGSLELIADVTTPDGNAPEFQSGYPAATSVSASGFTALVRLNEVGTAYCSVLADGASAPTSAAVIAASGSPIASGNVAVSSTSASFDIVMSTGSSCEAGCDVWCTAEDDEATPNEMASPVLTDVATDTTAPSFVTAYPQVSSVGTTSIDVDVQLDEPGAVYVVVVDASSSAPSVSQVLALQDASGESPAASGSASVPSSSTTVTLQLTGLESEVEYDVYVAGTDDSDPANAVSAVAFIDAVGTGDGNAPEFQSGYPAATPVSASGFTLQVRLNEVGTAYCSVLADGASAPTSAAVIAASGSPIASGNVAVSSTSASFDIVMSTGSSCEAGCDVWCTAEDDEATPNEMASPVLTGVATDTTAPSFVTAYPQVSSVGTTSIDVDVQLDEPGVVYVVVVDASSSAPSVSQVLALQDASGESPAASGSASVPSSSTTVTLQLTGLESEVEYDVYVAGTDDSDPANAVSAVAFIDAVETGDGNAPEVQSGYPAATSVSASGFTLQVRLNEVGTAYCSVLADGASAPTSASVIAASGSPIASGNVAVSSTSASFDIVMSTGSSCEAGCDVWCTAEDDEATPNEMASPVLTDVATDTTAPSFVTAYPQVSSVGTTSIDVDVQLDEPGAVYVVVVDASSSAPSVSQVLALQDASGESPAASGSASVPSSSTTVTLQLTGLESEVEYDVYVAGTDDSDPANAVSAVAFIDAVETGDGNPPEFQSDYPALNSVTASTIDVDVATSEDGTVYCIVVTDPDAVPDGSEVKSATAPNVGDGSVAITSSASATLSIDTGSSCGEGCRVWCTAEDDEAAPNLMASAIGVFAQTTDTTAPTFVSGYPHIGSAVGGTTEIVIKVKLNEPGTATIVAVIAGSDKPTDAQFSARTLSGVVAPTFEASDVVTLRRNALPVTLTGLDPNTEFDVWVRGKDQSDNNMAYEDIPSFRAATCPSSCAKCDGTSLTCTLCPAGQYTTDCVSCDTTECAEDEYEIQCQQDGDINVDHSCGPCSGACSGGCSRATADDCNSCAAEYYDTTPEAGDGEHSCQLCDTTVCSAGTYEIDCQSGGDQSINHSCPACSNACLATTAFPACEDASAASCVDCATGYFDSEGESDSNRECIACSSEVCGAGTYSVECQEGGDQTIDHSCPECNAACLATASFPACADGSATSCSECADGFYDTESEADSDRECAACDTTTCGAGTYEIACQGGGDPTVDHSCPSCNAACASSTAFPACGDETPDSCVDCAAGYYDNQSESDGDRECVACNTATCGDGLYSVECQEGGDQTVDHSCPSCHAACVTCDGPDASDCLDLGSGQRDCADEYFDNDDICVACSASCGAGEYESVACTQATDRVCSSCHVACSASSAFPACGDGTADTCVDCAAGNFDSESQFDGDRECVACDTTTCGTGTYSVECQEGDDQTVNHSCPSCNAACATCSGPDASQCLDLGSGQRDCADGYFDSDDICVACAASCGAGQYESVACTQGTDRVCSTCNAACSASSEYPACGDGTAESCADCAAGYYDNESEFDGDRECVVCGTATCSAGTYSVACQEGDDQAVNHSCPSCSAACSTCDGSEASDCLDLGGGQRDCADGYFDSDDICVACAASCGAGEYESVACTQATDRVCSTCSAACSASSAFPACGDGTADSCTDCAAGYYDNESDSDGDRECVACDTADCGTGTYSVECREGDDQTVNHSCPSCNEACATCDGSEASDCLDLGGGQRDCADGYFDSNDICVACAASCGAGEYESVSCSQATDRVCTECDSACDSQPSFPACGDGSATSCVACAAGYFDDQSENDSDRECVVCDTTTCATGTYTVACQEGDDQTVDHSCPSCDAACASCTGPDASDCVDLGGGQRDCADGYFDSDDICVACAASCGAGEYESVACTQGTDRVCSTCNAACSASSEFPACGDGTADSCVDCAAGYFDDESETDGDRECVACSTTVCSAEETDVPCQAGGDQTRDHECSSCDIACLSCTGSTAADCSDVGGGQRDCAPQYYDDSSACVSCATCIAGEYESVACTPSTNRVCSTCNDACAADAEFPACGDADATSCVECAEGYFDAESEADSDRECVACDTTTCGAGTYEVACQAGSDPTVDHSCPSCNAACASSTAFPACGDETADSCVDCSAGYYDSESESDGDRECVACDTATCGEGLYSVECQEGGDQTVDHSCPSCNAACVSCNGPDASDCLDLGGGQRDCADGYFDSNAVCVACAASCGAGEYESVACTQATDRVCSTCSAACSSSPEFPACGDGTADSCVECAAGYFDTESEFDSDRECVVCDTTTCGTGTYSVECREGGDQTVNHSCPPCNAACDSCAGPDASDCLDLGGGQRDCADGYFDSADICVACASACGAGEYESVACTQATDRVCSTCNVACSASSEFPACGDGTADTCADCAAGYFDDESESDGDRECVACDTATCGTGTYSVECQEADDQTMDHSCPSCNAACATCDGPDASDCLDLGGGQRDCSDGYFDSDDICVACVAACGAGEYESVACTQATDRMCSACDVACSSSSAFPACGDGAAESCVDCAAGYYDNESESDGDRECVACDTATCGIGLYSVECQAGNDQTVNHSCPSCNAACATCDGPDAADCLDLGGGQRDCADGYFDSNDICVACAASCGDGEYESVACSQSSDRVCTTCDSACDSQSPFPACADGTATSCVACSAGFFDNESENDFDRECTACDTATCGTGTYSVECQEGDDQTVDHSCPSCNLACTSCDGPDASDCLDLGGGQRDCADGYFDSDDVCVACAASCGAGEYESVACSQATDRACSSCSAACSSSPEYPACGDGTADSCVDCAAGYYDSENESDGDRECVACDTATCEAGTYSVECRKGDDQTVNHSCPSCNEACATCDGSEASDCLDLGGGQRDCADGYFDSNDICVACAASCGAGEYESVSCSQATDRVCTECDSACDSQPSFPACGDGSATSCVACAAGYFDDQSENDSDRECVVCDTTTCATGTYTVACQEGDDQTVDHSCPSCDAACASCTGPDASDCVDLGGGQRDCADGYFDSDDICVACAASCGAGEYESVACTQGTDRVCSTCNAACSASSEFPACGDGTADSCVDCAAGYFDDESETDGDRECAACDTSVCGAGTYSVECQEGGDQSVEHQCIQCALECASCSGPTSAHCSILEDGSRDCAGGYFNTAGVCGECRPCVDGEYEIGECTRNSDRMCDTCSSTDAACATCDNAVVCTSCEAGFWLQEGGVCAPCNTEVDCGVQEFFVDCSTTADASCAACDSSCDGCSGPTSADCTACASGFFADSGQCAPCAHGCDECDGPNAEDCATQASPEVQRAVFTATGDAIVVEFDRAVVVNTTPSPNDSCDHLVENATLLLGAFATCRWESPTVLHVLLGSDATIEPTPIASESCQHGYTLSPLVGAFSSSNGVSSMACIELAAPADMPNPIAVLSAPGVVGSCSGIRLNAEGSKSDVVRPLLYAWSARSLAIEGTTIPDIIQSKLATASEHSSSHMQLSAEELSGIGPFNISFEVTVSTFLRPTAGVTASAVVQRLGVAVPEVYIVGPQVRDVYRKDSLVIEAVTEDKACDQDIVSVLSTTWELVGTESGNPLRGEEDAVAAAVASSRNRRILHLPSLVLGAGTVYRFRVSTRQVGESESPVASADVLVRVLPSLPVALIGGQRSSGMQLASTPVRLNALTSYDPDGMFTSEQLLYYWSCYDSGTDGESGCGVDVSSLVQPGAANESVLLVTREALATVSRQITFSVRVSTPVAPFSLSTPAIAEVTIGDGPTELQVALHVVGASSKVPQGSTVRLRALLDSRDVTGMAWEWSAASAGDQREVNLEQIALSALAGPVLAVDTSSLPGGQYVFSLTATDSLSGGSSSPWVMIDVNAPPTGGYVQSSSSSVMATSEIVSVSAQAWQDVDEDLPLAYKFAYAILDNVDDAAVPISIDFRQTQQVETVLPGPPIGGESWEVQLFVEVRDAFGAAALSGLGADGQAAIVHVAAIAPDLVTAATALVTATANEAILRGDVEQALASAMSLSTALDTKVCGSPSCSGNGVCNRTSAACTCDPGWTGSRCSMCSTDSCQQHPKPCPGVIPCSGHGSCLRVPSGCVAGSGGCTATCTCVASFHGDDCSVGEDEWGEIVERRSQLVDLVARASDLVNFDDEGSMFGVMSSLSAVTSSPLELSADAARAAANVLERARLSMLAVVAGELTATPISASLSGAQLAASISPVVEAAANLMSASVRQSLADESHRRTEGELGATVAGADAIKTVARRLTVGQEPGEYPTQVLTSSVAVTAARLAQGDTGALLSLSPFHGHTEASVQLPATLGGELFLAGNDQPVDVRLVAVAPALRPFGAASRSPIIEIAVSAPGQVTDTPVSGLERTPLLIRIPDLSDSQGTEAGCSYLDVTLGEWSSRGMVKLSTGAGSGTSEAVWCASSHLTEFSLIDSIRAVEFNTVSPFHDAGKLSMVLDPSNRFVLIAVCAVFGAALVAWVAAHAFQAASSESIERTKETLFFEYGMIHKKVVAMEKNDVLAAERASAMEKGWGPRRTECRLMFVHLLMNMRTRHPWIAALLPARSHALVFPRTQQLACLVTNILSAFVAAAVFFGKNPTDSGAQVLTGMFSALCMLPSTIVFPTLFATASSIVSGAPSPRLYTANDEPSRGGLGWTRLQLAMVVKRMAPGSRVNPFAKMRRDELSASQIALDMAEEKVAGTIEEIVTRATMGLDKSNPLAFPPSSKLVAAAVATELQEDVAAGSVEAKPSDAADSDGSQGDLPGTPKAADDGPRGRRSRVDSGSTDQEDAVREVMRGVEDPSDVEAPTELRSITSPKLPHLRNSFSSMFGSFHDDSDLLVDPSLLGSDDEAASHGDGATSHDAGDQPRSLRMQPAWMSFRLRGTAGAAADRAEPPARGPVVLEPLPSSVKRSAAQHLVEAEGGTTRRSTYIVEPMVSKTPKGNTSLGTAEGAKRTAGAEFDAIADLSATDDPDEAMRVTPVVSVTSRDFDDDDVGAASAPHDGVRGDKTNASDEEVSGGTRPGATSPVSPAGSAARRLSGAARSVQHQSAVASEFRRLAKVAQALKEVHDSVAKAEERKQLEDLTALTAAMSPKSQGVKSPTGVAERTKALLVRIGWIKNEEEELLAIVDDSRTVRSLGNGLMLAGATSLMCGVFAIASSLFALHAGATLIAAGLALAFFGNRAAARLTKLTLRRVIGRAVFAVVGMSFEVALVALFAMAMTEGSPIRDDVLVPAWKDVWAQEWQRAVEEAAGNATVAWQDGLTEFNAPAASLLQWQENGVCCGFESPFDHPVGTCAPAATVGCQAFLTDEMVANITLYAQIIFGAHVAILFLFFGAARLVQLGLWLVAKCSKQLAHAAGASAITSVSRTGDVDLDRAVSLFQAVSTIQMLFRRRREERSRLRRIELRRFRILEAERRVLVTATYVGALAYSLVLTYVMLIFGVKFTPAVAHDWMATAMTAVALDVFVQAPAAVLVSTVVERYVMRRMVQTRLYRMVGMCLASLKRVAL